MKTTQPNPIAAALEAETSVIDPKRYNPNRKWQNTPQIMDYLQISEATLARFKGMGLPYSKIGMTCRYNTDAIDIWLEEHYMNKVV